MRRRTRARELALQFLYTLDVKGPEARDELDDFLHRSGASRVAAGFATELVDGVTARRDELDRIIGATAANWTIERMPPVDRNVLRLGAFELLYSADVPAEVALNEAIELGKRYSTAQSGAFVNGILDKLKSKRRLPALKGPAPDSLDAEEEAIADDEDDETAEARAR